MRQRRGGERVRAVILIVVTQPTKGALSQDTAKLMVFKLISAASRTWRRLQGENQLPKVIQGVKFRDGIEVSVPTSQNAA